MYQKKNYNQLTLFPADFLASLFPLPGNGPARKMTVISGRKWSELFNPSNPLGLLSKMLLESSIWHSTRCYLTWKIRLTPARRLLFQLAVSTPHTEETESGFWLTPSVTNIVSRSEESMRKRINWRKKTKHNSIPPGNLAEQLKYGIPIKDMRLIPTPMSSDFHGASSNCKRLIKKSNLSFFLHSGNSTSYPNPRFVEIMMGFPAGWTDLKPLEIL